VKDTEVKLPVTTSTSQEQSLVVVMLVQAVLPLGTPLS
jgi:hypothetical protein